MPKVDKMFSLEITTEQFLQVCSPQELIEIDLLLNSPRFQNKMKAHQRQLNLFFEGKEKGLKK
jgi:hypothetical protein